MNLNKKYIYKNKEENLNLIERIKRNEYLEKNQK